MRTVELYKALADESRLRLVNVLSHGYFNVQELTSILNISQSTVSHHLKVLNGSGLVQQRKQGTWAFYSLPALNGENGGHDLNKESVRTFLKIVPQSNDTELRSRLEGDHNSISQILASRRDQAHRYFETVANTWREIRAGAQGDDSYMNEIIKRVAPEATLLELGCGAGALLERILPRPGQTIGVDYSQAMLDEARQLIAKRGSQADLRLGNLEHLPVGDASVDIAVTFMVMHHVAEPLSVLKEAFRVLKPKGELLIIDLNGHHDEVMRERYADLWLGFDTKEFCGWLSRAGFKGVKTETLGSSSAGNPRDKKEVFLISATK